MPKSVLPVSLFVALILTAVIVAVMLQVANTTLSSSEDAVIFFFAFLLCLAIVYPLSLWRTNKDKHK